MVAPSDAFKLREERKIGGANFFDLTSIDKKRPQMGDSADLELQRFLSPGHEVKVKKHRRSSNRRRSKPRKQLPVIDGFFTKLSEAASPL